MLLDVGMVMHNWTQLFVAAELLLQCILFRGVPDTEYTTYVSMGTQERSSKRAIFLGDLSSVLT